MLARQFAVGFGIAIILPLLIYYGVATVYPPPVHNFSQMTPIPPSASVDERRQALQKQQEERKAEGQAYTGRLRAFSSVLFWVTVPLGIAALLLGAWLKFDAIGAGLMFGGIFSAAVGYFSFWDDISNGLRFASLLVAFGVLVFVARWKRNKHPT